MSLYDVLDQVIELLKRRGRVTYRALKREFNLDDDFVEDLKEELLFSGHPVSDEDGRGLVWTEPMVEPTLPVQERTTSVEPYTPDAERRQLTVMFVDMVDSTRLSGKLDPEDFRDIVRSYQSACTDVIQRYEGYIAQLLGDGLLVYFGYPQAHEDDAQRAIHAGLGIVEAIGLLNDHLEKTKDIRLAVRLGIHTGLVVVGEMGGENRQEQLALGETPNIAARIQGLAQPNTLVVSESTYRLVQDFFDCAPLGEQSLRGVSERLSVYRAISESAIQSRIDAAGTKGLTPLVGRHSERQLLIDCWEQARSGEGQVILINAEPGLGKSRMIQALREHLADEAYTRLECRSSPYYQNTALYPVIDLIQRILG
jgi:class 3 adenylate cyclase